MSKHLITLALAVTFLVAANVKADLTYDFNTANAEGWYVTEIFSETSPSTGEWYANSLTWSNDWFAWHDASGWNAADQGNHGGWVSGAWVTVPGSDGGNNVPNGFYAFRYTGTVMGGGNALGNLALSYSADDYLAAIYVNGAKVYSGNPGGEWWQYSYLTIADIALQDDLLDLVFVLQNNNSGGGFVSGSNPMGLSVHSGTWESAATPEPATLAVLGLGLAGLGVARRRIKK